MGIENNKITDYKVLVLYNTITEINNILHQYKIKDVKHMELFVSAFMTLKSITKYYKRSVFFSLLKYFFSIFIVFV